MQLVIPMSGIGQRFKNAGYSLPKPLIQISGKPIVQHVIEMFPGVEDVLFIVNRDHYGDLDLNLKCRLLEIAPTAEIAVIDNHKLGPAWAVKQAREFIKLSVPVVINYCDFACIWNFPAFREKLHSGVDGLIATYSGFHPHMLRNVQYAYLKLDESENLVEIQEKLPFTTEPMSESASSGTYGFGTGQILLDAIDLQIANDDSYNNEFYSSLTFKNMISSGKIIKKFEIDRFFQWGTPEDFEDFKWQKDLFVYMSKQKKRFSNSTRLEILAAGAGKRFVDSGYSIPKPFLPLGDSSLLQKAFESLGKPENSIGVLLQDSCKIPDYEEIHLRKNEVVVRRVSGLTGGQAESALISLKSDEKGSCIVGTCDSLIFPTSETNLKTQERTMGVWVNLPSEFAISNPNEFGWVTLNSTNEVTKSWVKVAPNTDDKVYVISGTFFFGDDQEAVALIESFLQTNSLVNGEYYLDSVLAFANEAGWKILGFKPEWFVSLGTPDEYETYRYWEFVFSIRPDLLVTDEE
jgi:NDP-sugar pyrophosphorylase family protein